LVPEAETWSREEALAKLADEAACVSAAVRLVRLAEVHPLCVPDPLPPKVARRLRVVALSEALWALGWETPDDHRLRLPVLIHAEGEVVVPLEGVEEEVALLCCAEDPELFPHLLIVPRRVMIVGDELQNALVAKSPAGLKFDVRCEDDYPYVALLWRGSPAAVEADGEEAGEGETEEIVKEEVEVARYKWDLWELAFLGPLSDKLPDPPGGVFELDLEQSEALIPVGGEIPEPPPVEPPIEEAEPQPPPY
jgi:hypothetical protein